MKKSLITLLLGAAAFMQLSAQNDDPIQLHVNAAKQIGTAKATFNGTNIEDLNNQTNGGVFSQLIHGEAFEENIDIDFLNLPSHQYVQVYVVLDETRTPHFLSVANIYTLTKWNNLNDKYDFNSWDLIDSYYESTKPVEIPARNGRPAETRPARPMKIGDLDFYGRFVIFDSIPARYQKILLDRINGEEQISRYWSKINKGNAKGVYTLKRGDAYMGRQNQVVTFVDGNGEVGLSNAGLNKMGINLVANQPYDGVLRVKSNTGAETIYLSLRDSKGNVVAEKSYQLKGDGSYEKVEFELTPSAGDPKGSFGISLKEKGEIELGFAFMQPGEWGRVNGLPLRKMMVEALKKQGITAIRYNGSMVDVGVDTYQYRWKKMLGPVDERRVSFRSGFNPYATHSFGIIEMLNLAEVIGAQCMIGMNINETYEDIRDFVEYVNGDVTTKWGALRAQHGHPEPYNLKHIQVHNEQTISRGYIAGMIKFAEAAWEVDPEMNIITSLNIGRNPRSYSVGTPEYELTKEMFSWFIEKGKADKLGWDPHFSGLINFADHAGFETEMGIVLQRALQEDLGHKLTLYPMEENGGRCDWDRGLAHAHNWNTLQRYADCFEWLGTANTFQPHRQHYMWDQGRIHYTSDEVWFQPSAYEDEMMSTNWLFNVLETSSSQDKVLDITAKTNDDKSELSIYVVNISDQPQEAVINVEGYKYGSTASVWTIGGCELDEYNTVEDKDNVVPQTSRMKMKKKDTRYTFPKYSYTVITLKR